MKSAKDKNYTFDIPDSIDRNKLINILKQIDISLSLRKDIDKYKASFENIPRGKLIMYCSTHNNINPDQEHLLKQADYIYAHFDSKEALFLAKVYKLTYLAHISKRKSNYMKVANNIL